MSLSLSILDGRFACVLPDCDQAAPSRVRDWLPLPLCDECYGRVQSDPALLARLWTEAALVLGAYGGPERYFAAAAQDAQTRRSAPAPPAKPRRGGRPKQALTPAAAAALAADIIAARSTLHQRGKAGTQPEVAEALGITLEALRHRLDRLYAASWQRWPHGFD